MKTQNMFAAVKVFKGWERENHAIVMKTLKPLIDNRGLEITSYSVNPINGALEIEIDNPKTDRRVVLTFDNSKEVLIYEYLKTREQMRADFEYSARVKNFASSKRIIETIKHLF